MRIAIVNDMMMAVEALRRTVARVPDFEIAWVARDGQQAVTMAGQDTPDLILMDINMPIMNGVEATRKIMRVSPCAILIVTATVEGNSSNVFEALGAGALDAVNTPVIANPIEGADCDPLLSKIRVIQRLIGKPIGGVTPAGGQPFSQPSPGASATARLILIGSSAGGPPALAEILKQVPPDAPPVVIVQHIDGEFAVGMADWLGGQTNTNVRLAREGDVLNNGSIYLAGTGNHLVFTSGDTLGYSAEPRNSIYRPSIDVCFFSAVTHVRARVAAAILTGMGRDGAAGLKALRQMGCYTIAQDRETSVVYGMPKAAAEMDAADAIVPLSGIVPAMMKYLSQETNHVRSAHH
ncbi:MAG: chemotaxis-specific protein-glutamate methyltransferase CheB [Candidatus Sumerlaeaceae bacterium]